MKDSSPDTKSLRRLVAPASVALLGLFVIWGTGQLFQADEEGMRILGAFIGFALSFYGAILIANAWWKISE